MANKSFYILCHRRGSCCIFTLSVHHAKLGHGFVTGLVTFVGALLMARGRQLLRPLSVIYFDRKVMTYKVMHKLCSDRCLEKCKPRFSFSPCDTRKSQNIQIGLNIIKLFSISQLIRAGIIHL